MSDVTNISPPAFRLANKLQVSEFFDVSVKTVDLWVRRGCPFIQRGDVRTPWVFDLLKVSEWRYAPPTRVRSDDPEKLKPRDRKDWYEGERVRGKIDEMMANLIGREEFDSEKSRILSMLTECLSRLPGRLEVACGLPPAVAEALRMECAAMTMTT